MAIAYDAKSTKAGSSTLTWTHTPAGTPKGVVVFVTAGLAQSTISGVTYGGVTMDELAGSPMIHGIETGVIHAYFLGANIPTGAQTVVATSIVSTIKGAICITLTATAGTTTVQAINTNIDSNSVENPSATFSIGGVTCFVVESGWSGQDAIAGVAPNSGWTSQLEYDLGTSVGLTYSYNTVYSDDVTIGWTQAAEDAMCLAVAIAEVTSSTHILTTEVATFIVTGIANWPHISSRVVYAASGSFSVTNHAILLVKANVLVATTLPIVIVGNDVSLVPTYTETVEIDADTAVFVVTNKKAQLIKYTPSGVAPMHTKTTILDALVAQLEALPEVATATRVLLSPANARKSSPYAGLIAGAEEVVVEDAANIRYELDVDIILLKKGIDIESMLDAVKIKLFSTPIAVAIGALQVRIVGQEPVALIDEDNYSSTRIVTVITYVITKDSF